MHVRGIHFRRFRGLRSIDVPQCADFNVLIGKNNAGKSSVLAGLDIALRHLRGGQVASWWQMNGRAEDEFTGRDSKHPLQIGIVFDIDSELEAELKNRIKEETLGFEKAIEELPGSSCISVIVSGALEDGVPFLFLQEIALGSIDPHETHIVGGGAKIFTAPLTAARDLFKIDQEARSLRQQITALDDFRDSVPVEYLLRERSSESLQYRTRSITPRTLRAKVEEAIRTSSDTTAFEAAWQRIKTEIEGEIDEITSRQTGTAMSVLTGTVKSPPEYVTWLMERMGSVKLLHFRETRPPIGYDEAAQLLQLKTKRGGSEQLVALQATVKALLGVRVDAFEPDGGARSPRGERRAAEMDVDDFLIEANGAGIREALRIVLDLELKRPGIALIEEPEIHLHPGLERALHSYLVQKSSATQMFVATHSTNFIDVSNRQSVFIVSKSDTGDPTVELAANNEEFARIPDEVGLRPSTVFMFDKLVFVEGNSDEAILRAFASTCGLDLAAENVAFVVMGGANNYSYFAADATLDLLSRRRIPMWFVIDRDERDDADLNKIVQRVGERARIVPLGRREMENYLLDAEAIRNLIVEKGGELEGGGIPGAEEIDGQILAACNQLRDRVVELRAGRTLLRPVYIDRLEGSMPEKLKIAMSELEARAKGVQATLEETNKGLDATWKKEARSLAPGSLVLDKVLQTYGVRYRKQVDGARLAGYLPQARVDRDITSLLEEIGGRRR